MRAPMSGMAARRGSDENESCFRSAQKASILLIYVLFDIINNAWVSNVKKDDLNKPHLQ